MRNAMAVLLASSVFDSERIMAADRAAGEKPTKAVGVPASEDPEQTADVIPAKKVLV